MRVQATFYLSLANCPNPHPIKLITIYMLINIFWNVQKTNHKVTFYLGAFVDQHNVCDRHSCIYHYYFYVEQYPIISLAQLRNFAAISSFKFQKQFQLFRNSLEKCCTFLKEVGRFHWRNISVWWQALPLDLKPELGGCHGQNAQIEVLTCVLTFVNLECHDHCDK